MIIAGTGHRPKYLPCAYDEYHPWLIDLKTRLKSELITNEVSKVISGMAIGWDTWLAEAALELGLPLDCYISFRGQENRWPNESQKRYKSIIQECDNVVICSERYHRGAFFVRDEKMVDDCDKVFALWNPEIKSGGTRHTVQYAVKNNVDVINMWRE